ncbi:aldehyde dehydrogenase family protein [Actinomycetes bacterium KLBMP 9797]
MTTYPVPAAHRAGGGPARDIINPATGKVVATVPDATAAEVDAAVGAARRAFDTGVWSGLAGRDRARVLYRAATLLQEHAEELAQLETADTGKPLTFSRMIDVGNTITHFEYYAGLAYSIDGATRQTGLPALAYTRREPLGVVAAITPFNFPMILSTSKIAPALAAGNTVIHKPAQETPLTALRIAELLAEAGLPDGVLTVVTGGAETGDQLVRHPGVDKVAFTGSTAVGRRIAAAAAETLKPVTVELGGKSANIIFADADLDSAAQAAVSGFVFNTGQFCMGGTRLLVERPVYDEMLARVAGGATHVPVGDPLDPQTIVGPMAGQRHLDKVQSYVDLGVREEGARLVAGGGRLDHLDGYYFAPTVLADVAQSSRVVQEEIFGPVVTVQPFDNEDEAVELANGTPFGLAAGLHTRDVTRAHRVAAALQAGMVWINTWGMLDVTVPFGGYKQSGYGREYGPEGLLEYTQTKSIYLPLT